MTTALVCTPRLRRRICVDCGNALGPLFVRHDCVAQVRHFRVALFLYCLQIGEGELAQWHYDLLPEREIPVVNAILDHVSAPVTWGLTPEPT